jgi:site-specific DNA recombinase
MTLEVLTRPTQDGKLSAVRRVGLVVRVSTDRQAMNPEGSLTTQLQRLRQHIEYKRSVAGEDWSEVAVYELKGISGKNSYRSAEFARLFAAIRSGAVNTILCTSLDRICRSVKDFLNFFEVLTEHAVEFVCLKQNYDTTTPQGKLFITIMMALAEFEREQTAERTRDSTAARAERGLWNGGRLLGYDLDQTNKGNLIPNPAEVDLVNFAFDSYLDCGSIAETTQRLNRRGYRTKAYTSRRDVHHPGSEFNLTAVQYLLKNHAYVGKKEVNKSVRAQANGSRPYRLVDAVWPGIVDTDKFEQVQRLMTANCRTNHNGARLVRHAYVLSGLLYCGRCESPLEARPGTGRLGVTYYYYVCRNKDCGFRVAAGELEDVVVGRIRELALDEDLLERIVSETDQRMSRQKPTLLARRRTLERNHAAVMRQADKLMGDWTGLQEDGGRAFLTDKLAELARRRAELESGLAEIDTALTAIEHARITTDEVRTALGRFSEVYACLTPFEKKELMRLVLHRAEVGDRKIVLEIHAIPAPKLEVAQSHSRSEPPVWLPGQGSNL